MKETAMNERQMYYKLIIGCLERYAGVPHDKAKQMVDDSQLFQEDDDSSFDAVSHDEPYFWAMELFYGRADPNNYWFKNPELWPPPQDYYIWEREQIP